MSINQQIDKLKGHVLIFSEEFRDLIQSFEMSVPMAENQAYQLTQASLVLTSNYGLTNNY
jgi:hypothetical protein